MDSLERRRPLLGYGISQLVVHAIRTAPAQRTRCHCRSGDDIPCGYSHRAPRRQDQTNTVIRALQLPRGLLSKR
jgi:hypothetical protein